MFPDGVAQRTRVACASALGTKYLARENAHRVGLLGSGWQAGAQVPALLAVRPIEEIQVYSLRRESREAFAREMRERTGANIHAVDSAEACVRDVDIIQCATSSMVPVARAEWLKEGIHIGCIKTQEFDESILDRCQRVAAHNTRQLKEELRIHPQTPNVPTQQSSGWWNRNETWTHFIELGELIAGRAQGRRDEHEITGFVNNVGMGLQFAALGVLVLEKAKRLGLGRELPSEWFSETVHP
jgi:ornithine cyclodeaminase/alanine dehydrogenase-like protein (mu-crystallin family)